MCYRRAMSKVRFKAIRAEAERTPGADQLIETMDLTPVGKTADVSYVFLGWQAERDNVTLPLLRGHEARINQLTIQKDANLQEAADFWLPWQERYAELRRAEYGSQNARKQVGEELAESDAWRKRTGHDAPSQPVLNKWLKD